jgi:hypothetical protein
MRALLAVLTLVGVALLCWLMLAEPHIRYDDEGFETRCNSLVAASSDGWLFDAGGGPIDAAVVKGEGAKTAKDRDARERGITDPFYIQHSLDGDCQDLRSERAAYVGLLAALTALLLAATIGRFRREGRYPAKAPPT